MSNDLQPGARTDTRTLGYQPALDGLRAVAVLAVIGTHGFSAWVPGGYAGVDVFFTLSGFLITCLLAEEQAATNGLRFGAFYMRRFLRLVPALMLVLLAHAVYCLVFYHGWERKAGLASAGVAFLYLSNWCRVFSVLPLGSLNHTWSLAVEEQFYLVWPALLLLVLYLTKSRRRALLALAILAGCFVAYRAALTYLGASSQWLYNGLDARADALLIGCCAGMCHHSNLIRPGSRSARLVGYGGAAALLALLGFFALGPAYDTRALFYGGYTALSLCSALAILALVSGSGGWMAWVLQRPALVWIGKVSYGLYLWHFILIRACGELSPSVPKHMVALLGVALTIIVAAGSYYLIEKPVLQLKKRFTAGSIKAVQPAAPCAGGGTPELQAEESAAYDRAAVALVGRTAL